MARGFLSGAILGLAVSVGGAVGLSLLTGGPVLKNQSPGVQVSELPPEPKPAEPNTGEAATRPEPDPVKVPEAAPKVSQPKPDSPSELDTSALASPQKPDAGASVAEPSGAQPKIDQAGQTADGLPSPALSAGASVETTLPTASALPEMAPRPKSPPAPALTNSDGNTPSAAGLATAPAPSPAVQARAPVPAVTASSSAAKPASLPSTSAGDGRAGTAASPSPVLPVAPGEEALPVPDPVVAVPRVMTQTDQADPPSAAASAGDVVAPEPQPAPIPAPQPLQVARAEPEPVPQADRTPAVSRRETKTEPDTESKAEPASEPAPARPPVIGAAKPPVLIPAPDAGAEAPAEAAARIGKPASNFKRLATGVQTGRLVSVGQTAQQPASDATGTETAEAMPDASSSGQPPITRYAAPFEVTDDTPKMAIVLIDAGDGPVGIEALSTFPYPLSLAVDTSQDDATARMKTYRAAGFEVLAMVRLPAGAAPSDVETTMPVLLGKVPEAVAVMEAPDDGIQFDRRVSDQVARILADTGHGLLLYSKGLNTAQKLAAKNGVPSATIFRDIDDKGQKAGAIRRFLNYGALNAGNEGGVVMVGRLRPDTVTALLLWGLEDRARQIVLAPVSRLLQTQQ